MPHPQAERVAVFVFGVVFVIFLIVLALFVPKPTPFQYAVFRIVLALAAAGVAAFIPGFIDVEISYWLRAGGAIAVFVIVYFFSPAKLVAEPQLDPNNGGGGPSPGYELTFVTDSYIDLDKGANTKQLYFTVWNRQAKQRVRISKFRLVEVARVPTEFYCCPERRSELTLAFGAQDRISKVSSETYEIPPLASNAFLATIRVQRGFADNNPVVLFGIAVDYSTPSGNTYEGRSDKLYLANYGGRDKRDTLPPFDRSGLVTFLGGWREIKPDILSWFPCPWSGSFLPGVTGALSGTETKAQRENEHVERSGAPIAILTIKGLAQGRSLYDAPVKIEIRDLSILEWSEFTQAYPSATLSCEGKYILDKYTGRVVRLSISYTNKGNAHTMLYPDWFLSSNDLTAVTSANELIPKEVRDQAVSPDYPAQKVEEIKTNPDGWLELDPGHPKTVVMYFKPIVNSRNPLYLTDSDSKISVRIR